MKKDKSPDERVSLSSSPVSGGGVRPAGECDREMWEAFFQGASQPIIILDRDHRVVAVNGAALKALKDRTEEEILGSPCYEVFHGTDQPAQECPAEKLRFEGLAETVEMEMEALGGTYLVSCAPLRDSSGKVSLIIHMAVDITDRKRAETELQKEVSFNRTLIQASPAFFVAIGADGKVILMNESMLRALGYTMDEVAGQEYLSHFVPEGDREKLSAVIEALIKYKEPTSNENHVVTKDGRNLLVEWHGRPIVNDKGEFDYFFGVGTDVTERKQAEEELRSSKELYTKLIAAMPDIVVRMDITGRIIFVNEYALQKSGYSRPEIEGQHMFSFLAPEDVEKAAKSTELMFEHPLGPQEYHLVMKDGTKLLFEVNGDVLRWEDGTPFGIVQVCRDITDRKRLEEERLELERRLFQTQKLESLGVLAGGIAHDFNNLLMGIQGYTSLILHDTQTTHPHHRKLIYIENLVRSGSDLTAQLLGFARGGKYEVKPLDLGMLIAKSADMFGRTKREVVIHTNLAKDLLPVDADQSQIEQVFLNLYLNAWQAMPGGGEIFIETRNVLLEELYASQYSVEPGRYVKVSVTDTGVGMDEETRKRIFEPFFTTKEMGRGSGLGLASAYGIIKNHGGIIEASSSGGHGSTFTIYLPASEKEPVREEQTLSAPRKGSETILLVDDQDMVVDAGQEMLRALGYKVFAARSGQEALELYVRHENAVALVLLDMIMPGMGGGETFDRLKEINPRIKVILSSGYSLDGQAQQIMERGCSGFIQKPFDMDVLSKKIREVLEA